MKTLQIKGSLQYVECDLSQKESHLGVKLYLSSHFKREPDTILMDETNLKKTYPLEITGKLPRREKSIKHNESIGASSFAVTTNEFGAPVYIDVGTFHIPIQSMLDEFNRNGSFEHVIPFVVHPADNFIKGKVKLRIDSIDLGGIKFDTSKINAHMVGEEQAVHISNYINSTMSMVEHIQETFPAAQNVQAPCEISESGLEFTEKVPIPFVGYALYETPQSNAGFWENTFEVICKRDGIPTGSFKKMDSIHKARTLVSMASYVSQYLDYISDTIDKNVRNRPYNPSLKQGFENMGSFSWGGDCEDTGKDIIMLYSSFMEHNIEQSKYKNEFSELKRIGKYYIPLMSLDVVHGAKVADQTEQIGAHLNTMFVPAHYFKEMLEKHPEGKKLSQKTQWPDLSQYKDLPVLVGEGTGKFDPLGGPDDIHKERVAIYSLSSMAPFKKDIMHGIGEESNFYIGHLMGITDYFFKQGLDVGGFLYGNINSKAPGGWTRGVYYTDLVNRKDHLALIPHPRVPPTVMETMNDVASMRTPPNKLILDENAPVAITNPLLDRITQTYPVRGSISNDIAQVPVYIRPHQISSKLVDRMIGELRNVSNLRGVTYELEPITNTIHGYRVLFHVEKEIK